MANPIRLHLPWIGWICIIAFLSFLPGDQLPDFKIDWISIDTLVHIIMYAVLAIFFLMGFMLQANKTKNKMNLSDYWLYLKLILVGISIGFIIELIQGNFIPKRYFDFADIVANTFGTIFGTFLYSWIGRKLI